MSTADEAANHKPIDGAGKLGAYGVFPDLGRPLPPELDRHIDVVVLKPRDETPSARAIPRKARMAAIRNEQDAIQLLGYHVLFRPATEDDGERFVISRSNLNLSTTYLPPNTTNASLRKDFGPLKQAQPDTTIGYIHTREAFEGRKEAPLEVWQEQAIRLEAVHSEVHFPFFTCQWKGFKSSEGQYAATLQGARDGACIVNYLHDFFSTAGHTPTVVDTCHFSFTTNIDTLMLWVHWREGERGSYMHYMECIKEAILRPSPKDEEALAGLVKMRKMSRNILEYAMQERLELIKRCISQLQRNKDAKAARWPTKARSKASDSAYTSATPSNPIIPSPNTLLLRPEIPTPEFLNLPIMS